MIRISFVALFAVFLFSSQAEAYPELSRHGYTNCTTCHISPSGGGLLNLYGRELSKEVLSTWSRDGEQYFAYNAYKKLSQEEKILLGGYFRSVQAVRDSADTRAGRFIVMQADLEGGYNGEKVAVVGSIGRQELRSGFQSTSRVFSRRHYALVRIGEQQNFRVGKFMRFYGTNDPNHNLYVRRDTMLGFDTESYNAEYSWLGEHVSAYVTGLFGSLGDDKSQSQEKGLTASVSGYFAEKHKVGVSVLRAKDNTQERTIGGPWAILSFTKPLFLLSELDFQSKRVAATKQLQSGYVTSQKLNFEWVQGLISFITYERKDLNRGDPNSKQQSYGTGIQFFPRPHFELIGAWQKDVAISTNTSSDLYWLLLHFYL
jgi:hypothetical protein